MACRCGGTFCIHAQPRHDMYGCRTPWMPSIQVTLTSRHGLDKCFSKQSQFFPDALLRSRSQSLLQQKQLCVRNFQILWLEGLGREIGDLPHHHHDNHFPSHPPNRSDFQSSVLYNYFSFSVFSHYPIVYMRIIHWHIDSYWLLAAHQESPNLRTAFADCERLPSQVRLKQQHHGTKVWQVRG